jgi:hypothetical protein
MSANPPQAILTRQELETPRTAAEILDWVYATHGRFTATKELRAAAREGRFYAKELIHEALPIALFASRYFSESTDMVTTHVIGNQQHDATVDDRRTEPGAVKFIEATVSDWSYVELLRMELLTRDGHAPGYGKVQAEGAKGRRTKLVAELEALDHDSTREQHIAGAIAAVKKKAENKYPDWTALVVRVDDAVPFREDSDVAELDHVAREALVPLIAKREFRALALEGARRVYLVFEL